MRQKIIITSIVLFAISLTQKCYCTASNCGDSIMAFLLGWFSMLTGGAGISWLANPLLIASWILVKKKANTSLILSSLATLFSLSFLLFDAVQANESGQSQQIISYKPGYWLWLLSCVTMMTGAFIIRLNANKNNDEKFI